MPNIGPNHKWNQFFLPVPKSPNQTGLICVKKIRTRLGHAWAPLISEILTKNCSKINTGYNSITYYHKEKKNVGLSLLFLSIRKLQLQPERIILSLLVERYLNVVFNHCPARQTGFVSGPGTCLSSRERPPMWTLYKKIHFWFQIKGTVSLGVRWQNCNNWNIIEIEPCLTKEDSTEITRQKTWDKILELFWNKILTLHTIEKRA